MLRRLLLLALLAAAAPALAQTPSALSDPALVQRYQATITPHELAAHLYVFASDYFEGRETGTRGERLAALYLAGQYQRMGVRPRGTLPDPGNYGLDAYFQPFMLERDVTTRAALTATQSGRTVASTTFGPGLSDGQSYVAFGGATDAEAGVVFAGYGVQHARYDDYAALQQAGIATTGQWLLILDGEPMDAAGRSLLTPDGEPTEATTNPFRKLLTAFQTGGARGLIVVADTDPRQPLSVAARGEAALAAMGALRLPGQGGGRRGFGVPPVFHVSSEWADQVLLAGSGMTVAALRAEKEAALAPRVFALPNVQVRGTIEKATAPVPSANVLAFIEGSDPALRDEVVVLSAHYDHIGIDGTRVGDQINNGADDDGSGTVALLEIAEAFRIAKDAGHGPRRSVLFLHVSGEEKGLLGSAYYADFEPVFPLAQTVANLNIDMIGRHDPTHPGADSNYVYIIGGDLISQELHDWNAEVNRRTGLGLDLSDRFNSPDDPNQFFRRSDHWNFGKHGIPFIFYFTGTHEDYHQPGDSPEKIDYDRMARIARLIFGTAWQVANADARPVVSGVGFN